MSTVSFDGIFVVDLAGLNREEKFRFVQTLWSDSGLSYASFDCSTYISYFRYIKESTEETRHHRRLFDKEILGSFLGLIQILKNTTSQPLSQTIDEVSRQYLNAEEDSIWRSLELCTRLWLTVHVNTPAISVGPISRYELPLEWPKDMSLIDLMESRWRQGAGQGSKATAKVDVRFTAAYLVNICGMNLNWTDSLTDHLRRDPQRRTLTIYRHKICLVNHLRSKSACPIPKGVLSETLDTLNLLFPFGDAATKQLLAGEGELAFYRLGNCGREPNLNLGHYIHWREELDDLAEIFQSPPRTWKQLATDRRNLMEWAAFWVAVMVAFLTLVSIPCNLIQTTYSVKAYHATLAQASSCPR
ncbi:hypothetical protein P154DRAFT_450111 [Amniculicola lignicola CBS 123094]|uniref:Uncharacterized protein n=1 Tax=Amniculicola lignicola CBS 123094 TaxID=1392246 RepID=A0A6A5W2W3_9PLEO|nr:hypothetical protein P154DRAFT_450111 [Amniculicola lignicola CBS 123094]